MLDQTKNLTRAERRKREAMLRSKQVLRWHVIADYEVGEEVTEVEFIIKAAPKDAITLATAKVAELVQSDYGADRVGPDKLNVKRFVPLSP
ncbi:hypothetical protein [Piscirickettsia litoralis]|uniref:Uncharacterized protein n=1 Tax=Piscirickettsia litoralis TaxID=1891921 RepID=A0ABX2ZXL3_9GAMM|nr:hypothetical protein [Piscirickettsia litoralis]ODN41356.1 hypothetical protein BGC07_16425 [Piscirickettsia litoralis]